MRQNDLTNPIVVSYILRHNDEKGMTRDEIEAKSGILSSQEVKRQQRS